MMPLACNLMIRYGMLPRIEGLRLHFINNQTPRLFSALAASSNERHKVTGHEDSLHEFISRLPIDGDQQAITQLIDGLHRYLVMPPFVERGECRVSKNYAWLLSLATHAVEKLVEVRSVVAFGPAALSVMSMVPALRYWGQGDVSEHKGSLQALVPNWPELNDTLYWKSIEQARLHKAAKSSESLTDDWSVAWLGHFWKFDTTSLPRLLDFMHSRTLQDDQLIALSTAFRVYVQADKPAHILASLQNAVANDPVLQERLDMSLNPPVSELAKQLEEKNARYQREREARDVQHKQNRDQWIAELRANPDRICNPENLKQGELTRDHIWLFQEIRGEGLMISRSDGAAWQALIPDFGESVAQAYREAAIKYWRHYVPTLRSEVERDNSIPYTLIFAMIGLEIEAAETADFPSHLSESEVRRALRYITWELNGFPSWFERIHRAFPELAEEAVRKELLWELENTGSDQPMHYILSQLVYHAPWLYPSIAPTILDWALANPGRINTNQHHCLQILAKGGISLGQLVELASRELAKAKDLDNIARWHALRVDCDPDNGLPEVERWLVDLPKDEAKLAAQIFIAALMGGSHARDHGPYVGRFRTAEHLKSLYVLMHRYIQAKEDIDRANVRILINLNTDSGQFEQLKS
jgi:hypothetical protein